MTRATNALVATALAIAIVATACSNDAEIVVSSQPDNDSTSVSITNSSDNREFLEPVTNEVVNLPDGWFEMAGYGSVLHVDGDSITPHYVTASTCVAGESFDNELAVDHGDDDGGVITLDLVGPTTHYRLLPLATELKCESSASDTIQALDELFATHYPFFAQRGLDWPTEIASISDAVDADPAGFDDALEAFMVRLGDGHTTLDDLDIDPDISAFGLDDVHTLADLEAAIGEEFDRTLAGINDLVTDESGSVAWSRLDNDTGYLIMVAFEGISGKEDDPVADRHALRHALDLAIADLSGIDRLVIDMRFNGGGYEDLAVLAAGYFVGQPTPAYRKWAHAQPDAFVQTINIEPEGVRFAGDVVIVTSPITASAAEVFTFAMVEVADATVVGNPSFGEFSDAIDWTLPNGTELTLSMENYTNLSGTNHEGTGLPVDVPAPFDHAISAAISHLNAFTSSG